MVVNPGSIVGGFRLLARLFPAVPLERVTALSLEDLQAKYRNRDRWGNFFGFLASIALGIAYFFLLDCTASWYYHDLTSARFLIRPLRVEFGVCAVFLSLASSTFVLVIFRWILGPEEYAIYMAYASHKAYPPAPFDFTKAFRLMFCLGFPPLIVLGILRIDNYTAFTDQAIVDNPFLSLGTQTEYPYAAVRGVYEARGYHARFEDKVAPNQFIVFTNGARWEAPRGSGGEKLEYQRRIIRFVADRSGRRIRQVKFVEDIPP
jgi:hypothetical protein